MPNKLLGIVMLIAYILVIFTIVWLLFSVRESFEDIRRSYVVDEARCMECMTFYQDVFQFTESAQIVPYITKRTEFLKYILRQFLLYNETTMDTTCLSQLGEGEKTISQVINCTNTLVSDLIQQCQEKGSSRSECSIIQKLNDQAIEKARSCGAKDCTASEFRERYKTEVNSIAQNVLACGEAFASDTDLCVKMYGRIMEAKKPVASSTETPEDAVVTQKELKQKMGEMTAFVMLNV